MLFKNPHNRTRRMYVSGKNIMNLDGTPFIIRGFNQGHGEVTDDADPAEDVSLGANTVRIIWRKWGLYQGTTLDGQKTGAPGDLDEDYVAGIVHRVTMARSAGLKVILAGDSNCGQNGSQGMPNDSTVYNFCTVNGVPGTNFFTPEGAAERDLFYQSWQYLVRECYGMVDFYEPLVEPSPPHSNQLAVSILQDELRDVILGEDPHGIIIIGGYPGYQAYATGGAYNPSWAGDSNTVLTCDLLDNAVTAPTSLPAKIAQLVTARNDFNVPVMVNQLGSTVQHDPNDSLLMSAAAQLRDASGGSIGWTFWEKVSAGSNSYGPYADNGSGRSLPNPTRLTNLSTMFKDTKTPAT